MKNFQYGQEVYIFFKGAGYVGEYKGVDNYDKSKPHSVQVDSMNRELSLADNDVFHSFSELQSEYPQVNSPI